MEKRLGERLMERGLVDERRLRSALSEAALWGRKVGEVLVARGDITADALLDALVEQLGIECVRVPDVQTVAQDALDLIPAEEARRRKVLPLELRGQTLVVALADPRDPLLLSALRTLTGCEIEGRLALASQIDAAIDRLYHGGARPSVDGPVRRLATPARGMQRIAPRPGGRSPTPPRGMPTQGSLTPARGLPREPEAPTPGRGFTIEGAPTRARRSVDEQYLAAEPRGDVAALRAEVELLRRQLQRAYDALRETTVAHRVLLEQMRDRGLLDVERYSENVRLRIERLKNGR